MTRLAMLLKLCVWLMGATILLAAFIAGEMALVDAIVEEPARIIQALYIACMFLYVAVMGFVGIALHLAWSRYLQRI